MHVQASAPRGGGLVSITSVGGGRHDGVVTIPRSPTGELSLGHILSSAGLTELTDVQIVRHTHTDYKRALLSRTHGQPDLTPASHEADFSALVRFSALSEPKPDRGRSEADPAQVVVHREPWSVSHSELALSQVRKGVGTLGLRVPVVHQVPVGREVQGKPGERGIRFGAGNRGDAQALRTAGDRHGFATDLVPLVRSQGDRCSSTWGEGAAGGRSAD